MSDPREHHRPGRVGVHKEQAQGGEFAQALSFWREVVNNPDKVLVATDELIFTAEGDGVKLFGNHQSRVWEQLQREYPDKETLIKELGLTRAQLELLGDFYRWFGAVGHCVDERLDEQHQFADSGVHEECGAANLIGRLVGRTGKDIENEIKEVIGHDGKQGLLRGTEGHHYALTVYISLGDQPMMVDPKKRRDLQAASALAFHVNLPLG